MASRSSSVSPGSPMMKYIFKLVMPHDWAVSTASRIRSLEMGFLSLMRSSSEPVSGAMVTERAPESARGLRTSGTIAGIRRDDSATSKPSSRLSPRISGQLGMIAHRGGDEAHPIGELGEPADSIDDGLGRVTTESAVVVAHPAVAAFLRAAARHLHEAAVAILGVRRDHVGTRNHGRIGHLRIAFFQPPETADGSSHRWSRWWAGTKYPSREASSVSRRSRSRSVARQLEELRPQQLRGAENKDIHGPAERERVDGGHRAPTTTRGSRGSSVTPIGEGFLPRRGCARY